MIIVDQPYDLFLLFDCIFSIVAMAITCFFENVHVAVMVVDGNLYIRFYSVCLITT